MAKVMPGHWLTVQAVSGLAAKLAFACANVLPFLNSPRPVSVAASSAKSATCSTKKRQPPTKTLKLWSRTSSMPDWFRSSRQFGHCSLTRREKQDAKERQVGQWSIGVAECWSIELQYSKTPILH